MKNKIEDLNNILFNQLEKLSDDNLKGDDLKEELERAKAIKEISSNIIASAEISLKAQLFIVNSLGRGQGKVPDMLKLEGNGDV